MLVSKGASIYFTINFAVWYLKTKLKHIMNKKHRNTKVINNLIKKKIYIIKRKTKRKENLISVLL